MTTATKINRQDLIAEANDKLKAARKADKAGDTTLRNAFLT